MPDEVWTGEVDGSQYAKPSQQHTRMRLDKVKAEPKSVLNHREYDYDPERLLHIYQAMIAIDSRYDEEEVD